MNSQCFKFCTYSPTIVHDYKANLKQSIHFLHYLLDNIGLKEFITKIKKKKKKKKKKK